MSNQNCKACCAQSCPRRPLGMGMGGFWYEFFVSVVTIALFGLMVFVGAVYWIIPAWISK